MRPTIGELFRQRHSIALHEVDILLAHAVKRDRTYIYGHPEYRLSPTQTRHFKTALHRRERGEPIAYITGHKEFFGLDFLVTRQVLCPRPDTELLVETVAKLAKAQAVVADIGTGCGNIAISLKQLRPDCTVIATDISAPALTVAKRNARRHKTAIQFYRGNVLKALPHSLQHTITVLCFNAPYLTKTEAGHAQLAFEPRLALTPLGAPTQLIARLLQQAADFLTVDGKVILEIGYRQAKQVQKLCRRYFPAASVVLKKDLGGFDRVVVCSLQN